MSIYWETIHRANPTESSFTIDQLSGAEEDAAMLQNVIADARATQSIHSDIIARIGDWEVRAPGKLSSDSELRNSFIDLLDGLRNAFVSRALSIVDVMFPMLLDRVNPAHAIILAVRDDIDDTVDLLKQNAAQRIVGKQISEIRDGQIAKLIESTVQTAGGAIKAVAESAGKALPEVSNIAKYLAYGIGGLAAIYALNLFFGGRK